MARPFYVVHYTWPVGGCLGYSLALMEKTVVKFRHCGKDIYSFSKLDVTLKQQNACSAERNVCPVCRNALVLGLLDAPVALPSPFTNGHETQCSFLLGANEGPWCLG